MLRLFSNSEGGSTAHSNRTGTDVFGHVVEYGYDGVGNRALLKLDGTNYAAYPYDNANRLTGITNSSDATTVTYAYDIANRLISRVYPNGITTTYNYDGMSRLTRLKDANTSATLFDRQYTYNAANQIGSITDLSGTRTFGYDFVDRLKTVTGSASETYNYDAVGNRTSSHLSTTYGYQSGQFNRLISTTSAIYGFDANGNTTTKSEGSNFWRYGWDHANRMVTASTRKQSVRYKYDALGRRIERNFQFGRERTKFTYDGDDVLFDDNKGVLTKYINGDGIDNKLRSQTGSATNYFLADHLGSTNGLADSTGAVTSQTAYDSFGNQSAALSTRYGFTGREGDDFTGLTYYRARYYDPKLGRFISEDPIGFDGGDVNLYSYAWNNPQNLVDPNGTDGCNKLPNGKCAPPPKEPDVPGEPPRRPPRFLSDPPQSTPTPWSPPPTVAPPSRPTFCECETAFPRLPDFYSLSAYYPIGGVAGFGVTFSIDRHGGAYASPGLNFGVPTGAGFSAMGGWLIQRCEPSEVQTEAYLTGPGGTYSVFVPSGAGAGAGFSSGGTAFLLGGGSPGTSYSMGHGYRYW